MPELEGASNTNSEGTLQQDNLEEQRRRKRAMSFAADMEAAEIASDSKQRARLLVETMAQEALQNKDNQKPTQSTPNDDGYVGSVTPNTVRDVSFTSEQSINKMRENMEGWSIEKKGDGYLAKNSEDSSKQFMIYEDRMETQSFDQQTYQQMLEQVKELSDSRPEIHAPAAEKENWMKAVDEVFPDNDWNMEDIFVEEETMAEKYEKQEDLIDNIYDLDQKDSNIYGEDSSDEKEKKSEFFSDNESDYEANSDNINDEPGNEDELETDNDLEGDNDFDSEQPGMEDADLEEPGMEGNSPRPTPGGP